jgi:hypothetical protein
VTDLFGSIRHLGQGDEEVLRRLLCRFEQDGAADALQTLEQELRRVKGQIDEVNGERDRLRIEKEEIDQLIVALVPGTSDVEALTFRMLLACESDDRARRIAQLRPDELHAQKAEIKAALDRRRDLSRLAAMIVRRLHGNR